VDVGAATLVVEDLAIVVELADDDVVELELELEDADVALQAASATPAKAIVTRTAVVRYFVTCSPFVTTGV
jgi:hypothetical protein